MLYICTKSKFIQYIKRAIDEQISTNLIPNKVVVLLGARRTGKTELIKNLISHNDNKKLLLNGDDLNAHQLFTPQTIENYRLNFSNIELLIIDEAQKIPEIGKKLKLLVDNIDGIRVLATGSSAFDLGQQLGEPLTGRNKTYYLFPFAQIEYRNYENILETKSRLENRLIFGNYPELFHLQTKQLKYEYLHELANSYLLKDILEFDGIRNAEKIKDLLRLIAFQTGNEVSLNELSKNLQIHKDTVARYLELLSKTFVIFKIGGFSRNLRKEISKTNRWYFYDNGIRNIVINNLNDFNLRNDKGSLWENYLISERIKWQSYTRQFTANYFWRTYDQQEIDWIEEKDGQLSAYGIKLNAIRRVTAPKAWTKAYPAAVFKVITPDNYLQWIMP